MRKEQKNMYLQSNKISHTNTAQYMKKQQQKSSIQQRKHTENEM